MVTVEKRKGHREGVKREIREWDYNAAFVPRDGKGESAPQPIIVEGEYQDGTPFAFKIWARIPSYGDLIEYGTQIEMEVEGNLFQAVKAETLLNFVKKYIVKPEGVIQKPASDTLSKGYIELKEIVYALHKASGIDTKSIEEMIKKKVNINDVLASTTLSGSFMKGDTAILDRQASTDSQSTK